jgi:hypothetical protein
MNLIGYIKANFLQLAMILLFGLLLLNRCGSKVEKTKPTVTIIRDTVWSVHDSIIHSKPVLVKSESVQKVDTVYKADTDYEGLLKQYNTAISMLVVSNQYRDSLRIDSIGYVYVTDTVSRNMIAGRSFRYNLKYPSIRETITIHEPYEPHRQLYIGGGIEGMKYDLIHKLKAGLLYKDRKDRIFIVEAGSDKQLNISAEVKTYWKLKF